MSQDPFKTSYPGSPESISQRSQDVRMISAMRLPLAASALMILWIDLSWYVFLIALSGGADSVFFFFFFFAILVASFRSGFRGGLQVTIVSTVIFTLLSLL